jgi:hypothetical protein
MIQNNSALVQQVSTLTSTVSDLQTALADTSRAPVAVNMVYDGSASVASLYLGFVKARSTPPDHYLLGALPLTLTCGWQATELTECHGAILSCGKDLASFHMRLLGKTTAVGTQDTPTHKHNLLAHTHTHSTQLSHKHNSHTQHARACVSPHADARHWFLYRAD